MAANYLKLPPPGASAASAKVAFFVSEDPNEPIFSYAVDRGVHRDRHRRPGGLRQDSAGGGASGGREAGAGAVAIVNGTPISRSEFDIYVKGLLQGKQQELTADQKNQVLDELISMQLLAAQADKDGLDKSPDTEAQLAVLRLRVMADAESQKFLKGQDPTDAELHAEYDTRHRLDGQDRISRAAHFGVQQGAGGPEHQEAEGRREIRRPRQGDSIDTAPRPMAATSAGSHWRAWSSRSPTP